MAQSADPRAAHRPGPHPVRAGSAKRAAGPGHGGAELPRPGEREGRPRVPAVAAGATGCPGCQPATPLAEFTPKLPPVFQKLVEKALAKDLAQRFQTGAEYAKTLLILKERLERALAQAGKAPAGGQSPGGQPGAGKPAGAATQQFTGPMDSAGS